MIYNFKEYLKSNHVVGVFLLANVFSFMGLFFWDLKCGLILSMIFSIIIIIQYKDLLSSINKISLPFYIFFGIEILSMSQYLLSDYSFLLIKKNTIIIPQTISYLLIPQLFFFLSGNIIKKESFYKIVNKILYFNFLFILSGIILYVFRPYFFDQFIKHILFNEYIDYHTYTPRLTSYMNSMIVGSIAGSSLILTLFIEKNNTVKLILSSTFLIGLLLSLQRGAWVSTALTALIYLLIQLKNKNYSLNLLGFFKTINKLQIGIFLLLMLFIGYNFVKSPLFDNYKQEIYIRSRNIPNAPSERTYQWKNAVVAEKKSSLGFWGTGIGLLSHKAAYLKFERSSPDGNYFRIFGELGYIGIASFVCLILVTLYRLIKKREFLFFAVISIYLFQAIGTNVFDLYYSSFIFWFIIGHAFTKIITE